MPLYEYQCQTCSKIHEVIQKFSDTPLSECPDCKGPLTKLMSMTSFSLKGSGWHTTDYKKASGAPKTEPAKAEPKTEASTAAAPTPVATPAPALPKPNLKAIP